MRAKRTTAVAPPTREALRRPLEPFFSPRTVAVIGASERPRSVGRALLENLGAFGGRVFPVNPRRDSILGAQAYPRIGALPGPVDLAVIATPAATVPGIVRECVAAGARAAVIVSAGFKEIGAEGEAREKQVVAAAQGRLRLLGPTCQGIMVPHHSFNAAIAGPMARTGRVAFLSQSGALCSAILDWSRREGVGFSAFVSVGGMADVGWGDLIDYLGDDPLTQSIVIYMESIGDARSFLSAAREVAFTKPIVVLKPGRTGAAVRAAASHTGALAGVDPVLDAAYRRAGVLRVETIEELFDMSEVLAKQPRPRGPRLAIVTNAGGPAAIAADSLVLAGGELGPLAPATVAALAQALPAGGAHGNPVDLLGDADAGRYAAAIEAVSRDPGCDGVLAILTPQAMTDATEVAARLKAAARLEGGKPLLACWMGGAAVEAGEAILNEAEIPTFKYPDRAARAFAHMWRYSANLQALYETPSLLDDGRGGLGSRAEAERLLRAIRRRKRTLLSTHESKQVLAAYGIPTVPTRLAATVEEAVARAAEIGYPVVLKLHSETVTHKDELGGVRLDLRDAAAVRQAWHAIKRSVTERAGAEHFLGVTVERMAPPGGFELLLGSSLDLQLGPVLVFGAGGRLVEIVGDQAFGLPPLNSTLALRLMETTRIFTALRGGRGVPPVDLVALGQTVVRFSQLVAAEPWMREIEINPLYASPDAVLALDARITLHDPAARAEQLPTPVIRPYPQQYATTATLRDGTPVTIRPIRPEDEPMMVKFHETLSDRSVYYRYFRVMSLDQRVSHARLARLCFVDYAREMALVTVHEDAAHHRAEIIGVGRLCRLPGTGVAEFAVVVSDGWQRRGLGTRLLTRLVDIGRKEGLARITGAILTDNVEMQRVCERVGFTISRDSGGESRAEIVL